MTSHRHCVRRIWQKLHTVNSRVWSVCYLQMESFSFSHALPLSTHSLVDNKISSLYTWSIFLKFYKHKQWAVLPGPKSYHLWQIMCMTNITTITTKTINKTFTQKHFKYEEIQTQKTLISYFNMVADVTVYPLVLAASRPLTRSVQWMMLLIK